MVGQRNRQMILRNIQFRGYRFQRTLMSRTCGYDHELTVFVSKNKNGTWKLTLFSRREPIGILHTVNASDDSDARAILGMIITHPEPEALCESLISTADVSDGDVGPALVEVDRCRRIWNGLPEEAHAI